MTYFFRERVDVRKILRLKELRANCREIRAGESYRAHRSLRSILFELIGKLGAHFHYALSISSVKVHVTTGDGLLVEKLGATVAEFLTRDASGRDAPIDSGQSYLGKNCEGIVGCIPLMV